MAKVKFANVIGITFALLGTALTIEGTMFFARDAQLREANDWLAVRSHVQQGYVLEQAWVDSRCDNTANVAQLFGCMDIFDARLKVSDDLYKVAGRLQKH